MTKQISISNTSCTTFSLIHHFETSNRSSVLKVSVLGVLCILTVQGVTRMSHFVMLQPDYKRMCRATEQTNFRIGECLNFTNQQLIAILMVMVVADVCSIGSNGQQLNQKRTNCKVAFDRVVNWNLSAAWNRPIGLKRTNIYPQLFHVCHSAMCQHVLTTLLSQGRILTYMRDT